MKNELQKKLDHLTAEQVDELIARYYAGEKTKDLIVEYSLSCRPSQLHKTFPPDVLMDEKCPHCKTPMVRDRPSRSSLFMLNLAHCPCCGHQADDRCHCEACALTRIRKEKDRLFAARHAVQDYCRSIRAKQRVHVHCADLSLRQAVSILALIRTCTLSDLSGAAELPSVDGSVVLEPLAGATVPFVPNNALQTTLLAELRESGLIKISEQSDLEAFGFKNGCLETFRTELIRWLVDVENAKSLIQEIERVASCRDAWPDAWRDQVRDLWFDIALAEVSEFYRHMATERGLPESGENATQLMLRNLLQSYSVAQCYRIIWAGAQQASDFLVRTRTNKKHASNYMISACQRWADRARAENWDVKGFRRNFELPRSMVSYVLFDVFLGIGEGGFIHCPNIDLGKVTEPEPQNIH